MRTYFQIFSISPILASIKLGEKAPRVKSDDADNDADHEEAIKKCIERQELESPYMPFENKPDGSKDLSLTSDLKRKLWREKTADGEASYS